MIGLYVQQYHFSMRCSGIVCHVGIVCGRMFVFVNFFMFGFGYYIVTVCKCVGMMLATLKHVVCIRDSRVVLIIHHLRDGCNRRSEQRNSTTSFRIVSLPFVFLCIANAQHIISLRQFFANRTATSKSMGRGIKNPSQHFIFFVFLLK